MDLKELLINYQLSQLPKYKIYVDKINVVTTTDFVKAMVNTIVRKYGREVVIEEILADNPNSLISTHITHIVEVGGLKIIADNDLLKNLTFADNYVSFKDMIVAVVITLNCSIALELKNLNLFSGNSPNYYHVDAMIIIASRLANHTLIGKKHQNGLEYYANIMIFDNLINNLTD